MNTLWKQRVLVAAVAALASAAVIGCGGGESSNGTTAPLTKSEFIKQGDKICEKRLEEKDEVLKSTLEQLSPSEKSNPSNESLKELGESVLPPVQQLTNELSELPAPVNDKAAVAEITSELEAGLKQAEADPSHLIQTDPFRKAGEAAKAYGFKSCVF